MTLVICPERTARGFPHEELLVTESLSVLIDESASCVSHSISCPAADIFGFDLPLAGGKKSNGKSKLMCVSSSSLDCGC